MENELILFETADKEIKLTVPIKNNTVWLNRKQLAELFGRDVKTIGKHINNALKEELDNSVVANFATTASDGKVYQVEHYNLDMIISIGYRVKSNRGVEFRKWANSVLKQYIIQGYAINEKRLEALQRTINIQTKMLACTLEVNSIIYSNQKLLYDALYHAASATLNELSKDAKYLGADIGYICILHTWGSAMNYHPHIHTIVLGGGLDDENKWKDTGGNFFLPYGVISKVFRGKYLDELKSLWNDSKLKFHGTAEKYQNSYRFKELLDKCYEKNWVTYCKETFNGAQSVINYLGKYTHRIAISNHRIKSMTDTTVTYVVKDYKNEGCWKEKTISGEEFIRRFMMHVPPKRFVRIRHYGLLSCRNKRKKITLCRNLLGCKKYISTLKNLNAVEMIKVLYHIDVCKCSSCGGNMVSPRKDKYSSSFHAHMRC